MANVFLAWQNRIDSASLSGGSWSAGLPLANLQSPVIQRVARSSSASTAATQFLVDLGVARPIGVMALIAHTITAPGKVRLMGSDATAALTNLLSFPSDMRNTVTAGAARPWTNTGVSVALVADGPDGSSSSKLQAAMPGFAAKSVAQTFTAADNAVVTVFVFAEAGECSRLNVRVATKSGAAPSATFDLAAGSLVSTTADAGSTLLSATITRSGDWYRCAVTYNVLSGAGTPEVAFGLRSTAPDALAPTLDFSFTAQNYQADDSNFNAAAVGDGLFLSGATVVVTGSGALYDSGWVDVWPYDTLAMAQRNWEDDNFWTGELTAGDLVGLQSPFVHILSGEQFLRYWSVQISNTSNSAGYIDIGRCILARGWRPGVNYSYGAEIAYFDPSPSVTTLSGTMYFDQRPKGRTFRFAIETMTSTEAYSYALDMQRQAGVTSEVLLVPDSDDTGNVPLRAFAGRLTALNGIGVPDPSRFAGTFELKEII